MVKSPCTNICIIDKNDEKVCAGCKRNKYEIFNWIYFTDNEKKLILSRIKNKEH